MFTAATTVGTKHQSESMFDECGVQIKKCALNVKYFQSKV